MEVITIEESPYGDEYWFGGSSGGIIDVAERWVCGGEWFKNDAQKLEIVRNEALAIKEALEILQEGKTPRQLAEENEKLRAALKRFISYGNNFAYRSSDGNPYLQAIEALGENE